MIGDFERKLVSTYIEKNYPDYYWTSNVPRHIIKKARNILENS